MSTKLLKVRISDENYYSVHSLAVDANMTKSDVLNMILDDFFKGTNKAKILQNILVEHTLN